MTQVEEVRVCDTGLIGSLSLVVRQCGCGIVPTAWCTSFRRVVVVISVVYYGFT